MLRSPFRVGLLVGCALALGLYATLAEADDPEGKAFKKLYNGKDLSGWTVLGGKIESWQADGELLSCVAAGGGWLRTEKMYSDYVLRMEFRVPPGGNSGVGLRFPGEGNPAFAGMEVQILDDEADKFKDLKGSQYTGSIYSEVMAKRGALKPAGEFNAYEITCNGPLIKIVLNGQVIAEADIDKYTKAKGDYKPLSERPRVGYIGMQSHGSRVDFRNIEIRDLTKGIQDPQSDAEMRYVDIMEGKGPEVPPGARVRVHYTGRLLNGEKFDSSRDRGKPIAFPLSGVIDGWKLGIPGMKVGGRRKLVIPYQLAYGERGFPPAIPAKATLVFDVELLAFQ